MWPPVVLSQRKFLLEMFTEGEWIVWDFTGSGSAFTQPVGWGGEFK